MRRIFYQIAIVSTISCAMLSCNKGSPIAHHPTMEITRETDSVSIFSTNSIDVIFSLEHEGIVIPLNKSDSIKLEDVTTRAPTLGGDVIVHLMGDKVGEIHVMAGLGNGFIYLLGNFNDTLDLAKSSGIRVLNVKELPFSQQEIANLLGEIP